MQDNPYKELEGLKDRELADELERIAKYLDHTDPVFHAKAFSVFKLLSPHCSKHTAIMSVAIIEWFEKQNSQENTKEEYALLVAKMGMSIKLLRAFEGELDQSDEHLASWLIGEGWIKNE